MDMSEGKQKEHSNANSPAHILSDLTKVSPRVSISSSARFGTLSHHSFFSRHNPHPNRVRHISGLNGSPVCIVNDDWYSNTPLFPHPLIRSHPPISSSALHPSTITHADGVKPGAALLSEAWREELKDLATKVSLSAAAQSKKAEHQMRDEERVCMNTQYSSETGRIVPPTSWRNRRRDVHTVNTRTVTHTPHTSQRQPGSTNMEGQEVRVLELLCQILQTDSLSLVQQWLLLAGDKEKELVLGMLQQAMSDASAFLHQSQFPVTSQTEPQIKTRRKRRMRSVCSAGDRQKDEAVKEKPELIGDAEVLRLQHSESEKSHDASSQREHSC